MTLREIIARWLAPEAFRTVERYHYLRATLSEAERWLGYDFPEVDATIMWAKVSEVNHFRAIDAPSVEAVPGKPWIWSISDFREHLRGLRKAGREAAAREIWKRFAPTHNITWEEESHQAEYFRCADAAVAAAREAKPTLVTAPGADEGPGKPSDPSIGGK